MAIEDGLILACALDAHPVDIARGFAAYESARKGRTSQMVAAAAENAKRITNPIFADETRHEPSSRPSLARPR